MSVIYPLSIHRRIEWAERIKSLRQTRDLAVTATERALQRALNDGSVFPIPVRRVVDSIQLDRSQSRD
jgi:hypothetical protein